MTHVLHSLITEHDGLKQDIELIKEFLVERKREAQVREQHGEDFSTDDDDARSVATVIPHELGRVVLPRPEESTESASGAEPTPSSAEDEKPTTEPTFFTAVDEQSISTHSSDTGDTGYHPPSPLEPAYEEPSPASSSGNPARSHQRSSEEDRSPSRQTLAVDNDLVELGMTQVGSQGSPRQQSKKPRLFVWGCVMSSALSRCRGANSFVNVPSESFREKENGRLGLSNFPRTTLSDVSFPVELRIPGVHVVGLAVSGWWVWVLFLVKTCLMPFCCRIPIGQFTCSTLMEMCMSRVRVLVFSVSRQVSITNCDKSPCTSAGKLNGESVTSGDGFSDPQRTAPRPMKLRLPARTLGIR